MFLIFFTSRDMFIMPCFFKLNKRHWNTPLQKHFRKQEFNKYNNELLNTSYTYRLGTSKKQRYLSMADCQHIVRDTYYIPGVACRHFTALVFLQPQCSYHEHCQQKQNMEEARDYNSGFASEAPAQDWPPDQRFARFTTKKHFIRIDEVTSLPRQWLLIL